MSTLIVSLPVEPATSATEWAYAVTDDGRALTQQGRAPAALLPLPRGPGAEVVAVVPGQAIAWQLVDLPKGISAGSPRLRAVLEGLLEEQLLDEAESLHLALGPGVRGGEQAWVAVCDRNLLRAALKVLEAAGRTVTRIVPEFTPDGKPVLTVLGDPEHPVMVASGVGGVLALPLSAATLPLLPAVPQDARHFAEPAVASMAEHLLARRWKLQQTAQRMVRSARGRWDLAQFEFASSSRARVLKKFNAGWIEVLRAPAWRPARWGAALLLVANLAGLNAWAWKERSSLNAKQDAVRATLRETFPQVKLVVDAPVQMEREVSALRQQTGAGSPRDLDALMGALASVLPAGRSPSALDYGSGQLRATGLPLSPQELSGVSSQLKPLGYTASAEGDTLVIATEDAR
jgi:general secretion pathway protein L